MVKRIAEQRVEVLPIKRTEISFKYPENIYVLQGQSTEVPCEAQSQSETGLINVKVYTHTQNIFNDPCPSKDLGFFLVNPEFTRVMTVHSTSLKKAMKLTAGRNIYIIVLRHSWTVAQNHNIVFWMFVFW